MLLTRRTFLAAGLGGAASVSLPRPGSAWGLAQSAGAASIASTLLADNLYLLSGAGANVVALTAADGVVLVDGGLADQSAALLEAVSALSRGARVTTLFNTHWHPEQTGSNEALGTLGATIIAQENTRLWLATDVTWSWNGRRFKRLAKIAQPNKTFYTTGTLALSDERREGVPADLKERREGVPADLKERPEGVPADSVVYGYLPDAAHTDGDLYVYFPQQNVLAVGDAVCGQGWPVVDWATGGWIGGIVGGLQRLQTLANEETRIVPGRGPVLTLADLKAQSTMYGTIYDRLTQLLNKGRGPSEAVAAKPTKEFDAQMGDPDEFVRRAFESLWAYLSPDA
jgi:glyoxylase-like metal-dependent hydrolase (beta-lactamase superfamily II)